MKMQLAQRHLIVVTLTLLILAGCGGGDSSSSAPVMTPPVPSLSGQFTDDPVAGLSYTTSSGYSATTDAKGNFKYNSSETVTFKIGNLVLGTAKGGNTLSPIDLATTNSAQTTNLYVLLQSLNNRSAANTITIPEALANANLSSIDLTLAPATFASTGNSGLVAALTSAGITTGIVAPAAALVHVNSQFQQQAAGVWQLYQGGVAQSVVFRFDASGGYLMGEAQGDTTGGMPGIETGTIAVDPLTGHFAGAVVQDTNGTGGLSNLSPTELTQTMKLDGSNITIRDSSGTQVYQFQRVLSNASSLVGVWALNSTTSLSTQHFIFFADGHYMMIDPLGDTEPSHCGDPGIEYGTYTFSASTGQLQITGVSVDTNGCVGANDTTVTKNLFQGPHTIPGKFASDGSTFNMGVGAVLMRVSP